MGSVRWRTERDSGICRLNYVSSRIKVSVWVLELVWQMGAMLPVSGEAAVHGRIVKFDLGKLR